MPLGHTHWLRLPAVQAFLRLTARGSGDAAFFAATKAKGGGLVVTAKHDELQKQVWHAAGQLGWLRWRMGGAGWCLLCSGSLVVAATNGVLRKQVGGTAWGTERWRPVACLACQPPPGSWHPPTHDWESARQPQP